MDGRFSFLNGPSLALDYGTVMSSWEKMGGSIFTSEVSPGSVAPSPPSDCQAKITCGHEANAATPDFDNTITLCDLFRPDEVVFNSLDGCVGSGAGGSSSWGAVVPGGSHIMQQHFEPASSDMMVPCLEFPPEFIMQEPFVQAMMPYPHGFMCPPVAMYHPHHHPMPMCLPSPHAHSPMVDEGAGSSVFPSCSMHSYPHPAMGHAYPAPQAVHMVYPALPQPPFFPQPMLSRQPSLPPAPAVLSRNNSVRVCAPSMLSRTESAGDSGKFAAVATAAFADGNGAPEMRSRSECLERYREKKARRLHTKMIRYELRKINADNRPRFKGRFVKKGETAVV